MGDPVVLVALLHFGANRLGNVIEDVPLSRAEVDDVPRAIVVIKRFDVLLDVVELSEVLVDLAQGVVSILQNIGILTA